MSETSFSDIGKIQALSLLYEGTPFNMTENATFKSQAHSLIVSAGKTLLEGIDFDLMYFPLMHLGYKCVVQVTGELYSSLAHPRTLSVNIGVSAKLDFPQIKKIWDGIVSAAKEHGYSNVHLDLQPSKSGLAISALATGEVLQITEKRRPAAKSKDLVCISGSLGAAFMGLQVLEREKKKFETSSPDSGELEKYKMLVGSYLKPELSKNILPALEDSQIIPSFGYFVSHGLADAVKRLNRDCNFGVKIYADKIPFEGNTFSLGKEMNIDPISAAMNGGEDCRLMFTIPILEAERFRKDFQVFDIIGHLASAETGTVLVSPNGLEHQITAPGWND